MSLTPLEDISVISPQTSPTEDGSTVKRQPHHQEQYQEQGGNDTFNHLTGDYRELAS